MQGVNEEVELEIVSAIDEVKNYYGIKEDVFSDDEWKALSAYYLGNVHQENESIDVVDYYIYAQSKLESCEEEKLIDADVNKVIRNENRNSCHRLLESAVIWKLKEYKYKYTLKNSVENKMKIIFLESKIKIDEYDFDANIKSAFDYLGLDDYGNQKLSETINVLLNKSTDEKIIKNNFALRYKVNQGGEKNDERALRLENRFVFMLKLFLKKIYNCVTVEETGFQSGQFFEELDSNVGEKSSFVIMRNLRNLDDLSEKWNGLCEFVNKHPESVFVFLSDYDFLVDKSTTSEKLYWGAFNNHIDIIETSKDEIFDLFIKYMGELNYNLSEEFKIKLRQYINVVYPKAKTRNDEFVYDLRIRVCKRLSENGKTEKDEIDENDIPRYNEVRDLVQLNKSVNELLNDKKPIEQWNNLVEKLEHPDKDALPLRLVLSGKDFDTNAEEEKGRSFKKCIEELLFLYRKTRKVEAVEINANTLDSDKFPLNTAGRIREICEENVEHLLWIKNIDAFFDRKGRDKGAFSILINAIDQYKNFVVIEDAAGKLAEIAKKNVYVDYILNAVFVIENTQRDIVIDIEDLTEDKGQVKLVEKVKKKDSRKSACNVLLLSLSTFPKNMSVSKYKYNNDEEYNYFYQLEPVPQVLAEELKTNEDYIDKVILLCTEQTQTGTENETEKETKKETKKPYFKMDKFSKPKRLSEEDYFKRRMSDWVGSASDTDIDSRFISIPVNEEKPEEAVGKTIKVLREIQSSYGEDVRLYLDEHGGFRGTQLVLEAIVSLLGDKDRINVEGVYTVEGAPGKTYEVKKSKNTIEMFDFVAGMNEFTNYGRIDSLERYYAGKENKPEDLLGAMRTISSGLQLCDTVRYEDGLEKMGKALKNLDKKNKENEENKENKKKDVDAYINIFLEQIRMSYGELLSAGDEKNSQQSNPAIKMLETIKWCAEKGFIQQALTYIEDRMPEFFVQNSGIIKVENSVLDKNDVEAGTSENDKRKLISSTGIDWKNYENVYQLKFYKIFNKIKREETNRLKIESIAYLLAMYKDDFNDIYNYNGDDQESNYDIEDQESNYDIDDAIVKAMVNEELSKGFDEDFLKMFNLNTFLNTFTIQNGSNRNSTINLEDLNNFKNDNVNNLFSSSIDVEGIKVTNINDYFKSNTPAIYKELFLMIKKIYGGTIAENEKSDSDNRKKNAKLCKETLENYFVNNKKDKVIDLIDNDDYKEMKKNIYFSIVSRLLKDKNEKMSNVINGMFNKLKNDKGTSVIDMEKYNYGKDEIGRVFDEIEKEFKEGENNDGAIVVERLGKKYTVNVEKYIEFRIKQADYEWNGDHKADYMNEPNIYCDLLEYLKDTEHRIDFKMLNQGLRYGSYASFDTPYEYNIRKGRLWKNEDEENVVEENTSDENGEVIETRNEEEIVVKDKDKVKIEIAQQINSKENRIKLDRVLRLHTALKNERNNCNHASDSGTRIYVEDVQEIIKYYVDECRQLYNIVNGQE